MGKTTVVAEMLGTKGVRLEGLGCGLQQHLGSAFGEQCILFACLTSWVLETEYIERNGEVVQFPTSQLTDTALIHNNDDDFEFQRPSSKKMKEYVYDKYDDIVSELGTYFTTPTTSIIGTNRSSSSKSEDVCITEGSTILRERESATCTSVPISPGDKENILGVVKQMSRKDLEELILTKVVEVLVKQSEAGKFRGQVAELQKQKDILQEKISHLHKQIVKMGKAIQIICENAEDASKQNKIPKPVKLYRTVGLQVNTGNCIQKVIQPRPVVSNGASPQSSTVAESLKLNGVTTTKTAATSCTTPIAHVNKEPQPTQLKSKSDISSNQSKPAQIIPSTTPLLAVASKISNNDSSAATTTKTNLQVNGVVNSHANTATKHGPLVTVPVPVPSSQGQEKMNGSLAINEQLPKLPHPIHAVRFVGRTPPNLPPKPVLTLTEKGMDIVLTWTMNLAKEHPIIKSYQIYSCVSKAENRKWTKVGDAPALALPMACTLSRFNPGNSYIFIVRAVDSFGQTGPFCEPRRVHLRKVLTY